MAGCCAYTAGLVSTDLTFRFGWVMLIVGRDREWQKWPVTIVTGAYIGFAVGKLAGGLLLKGRKIMFN